MPMGMTQLPLDSGIEHAHLRLTRALEPFPRQPRFGGGARGASAPDARSHARDLAKQLESVRDRHVRRETVLGITPELVMVIEVSGEAADIAEVVEKADLRVLGLAEHHALVAFSSDPDLTGLRERLDLYGEALTKSGSPRYWSLLDPIICVRPLEPEDIIDDDLLDRVSAAQANDVLRVDIECWCTDEIADTERRHRETKQALEIAGGKVLDSSCRPSVGFSLIRADIPAGRLLDVAATDRVSRMSLLPRPVLVHSELRMWSVDELPIVLEPPAGAATVAVIDSGIRTGHPLLSRAVVESLSAVPGLADGSDEHGHGSMVASLALYGSLEQKLAAKEPLRPAGRVLGIRVLNEDNNFPDAELWQTHLERAVILAINAGARVINLSLGDADHPYRPPAPAVLGAVLDNLVRESNVVLVVSAGNVMAQEHDGRQYAARLLRDPGARIAPPAMSSLALTVGALVPDEWQGAQPARESVDDEYLGRPGDPSPISRTGPGVEFAIKPELTAPGGTYIHDRARNQVRKHSSNGKVVGVEGASPERLLDLDLGTSFAAPLVSHAVLKVFGRYPWLSANAARALVLASAREVPTVIEHQKPNGAKKIQLNLSGFGRVDAERAEFSDEYRVVLLAEEAMAPDQVHFYDVPVPDSFYVPGRKQLAVALAFDPQTRGSRLKYMASRMSVFAYRGCSVDDVKAKYAASGGEPPEDLTKTQVLLSPADKDRLLGANQAASAAWKNRWERGKHDNLVVVVRNSSRWPHPDYHQSYALAIVLEVEPDSAPPIYTYLHTHFEALAQIEIETEGQTEIG